MKYKKVADMGLVVLLFVSVVFSSIGFEMSRAESKDLLVENTQLKEENEQLKRVIEDNRDTYNQNWGNMNSQIQGLSNDYEKVEEEKERLLKELEGVKFKEYTVSRAEVELLGKCAQTEAGLRNDIAQKNIVQVILNRVESPDYPNTISEVIYQKINGVPQFSTAYDGAIDNCVLDDSVLLNVYRVLVFGVDLPDYVQYFYSAAVEENWVCELAVHDVIEGTVFAYVKR